MAKKDAETVTKAKGSLGKRLLKAAVVITLVNTAGQLYAEFRRGRAAKEEIANEGSVRKIYSAFGQGREIVVEGSVEQVKLKTVLGGVSLNLAGAQIDTDVFISVRNVIGGVSICVPEGVNLRCDEKSLFGGVVNTVPEYEGENVHTIYLEANNVFGGLSVRAVKSGDDVVKDYFEEDTFRNISKEKDAL